MGLLSISSCLGPRQGWTPGPHTHRGAHGAPGEASSSRAEIRRAELGPHHPTRARLAPSRGSGAPRRPVLCRWWPRRLPRCAASSQEGAPPHPPLLSGPQGLACPVGGSTGHLKKRHVLSFQETLLVHVRVADERAVLSRVSISWRGDRSGQSYKPKGLRGVLGDTRTLGSPQPGAGQRGRPLSPRTQTPARAWDPTSDAPRGRGPGCWDSYLCPSNPALPASVSPPMRQDSKTRKVRASDRRVTLSQVGQGWGGTGHCAQGKRRPGMDVSPDPRGRRKCRSGPHPCQAVAQAGTGCDSESCPVSCTPI